MKTSCWAFACQKAWRHKDNRGLAGTYKKTDVRVLRVTPAIIYPPVFYHRAVRGGGGSFDWLIKQGVFSDSVSP